MSFAQLYTTGREGNVPSTGTDDVVLAQPAGDYLFSRKIFLARHVKSDAPSSTSPTRGRQAIVRPAIRSDSEGKGQTCSPAGRASADSGAYSNRGLELTR